MLEHVYTCPSFLTAAGFDLSSLSASSLWQLIRQTSALVDALTQQWFNADWGEWFFSGRGKFSIAHASEIPLGAYESVVISNSRSTELGFPPFMPYIKGGTQSDSSFQINGRILKRQRYPWPCGMNNIRMIGFAGWVEDPKALEGETSEELALDATTLQLSSVLGLRARDVVDVVGEFDQARLVVTGVDRATRTISFDAGAFDAAIPAGAVFRCGGQTPRAIESLATFFFQRAVKEASAYADGAGLIDPARIRKELTDGYSYELFGNGESSGTSNLITGHMVYDQIISKYSRPGLPGVL